MADSTLQAIMTMVRRITRSPSPSQLSDAQIMEYINTFFLFDFPENLRLFSLRVVLSFYTQPNIDVYPTNTTDPNNALYQFQDKYVAVHPPLYIYGVPCVYTQERNEFYAAWPQTNFVKQTGLYGDGTVGPFVGTLTSIPVLQNNVSFNVLDIDGTAMIVTDYPTDNVVGLLGLVNATPAEQIYGTINYITGTFTVEFPRPTQLRAPIHSTTIPYVAGRPVQMLYFNNEFTLRPVPHSVYTVEIEADMVPTELLATTQNPQIKQWWQYIALGACMKVFRDRMDWDSAQALYPEYEKQERLVLRTTLVQQANERTETVYTTGKTFGYGYFGGSWPY